MWAGYHKGGDACGFPPTKLADCTTVLRRVNVLSKSLQANSLFRSDEEGTELQRFRDMGGEHAV